jgi:hypothetical protein
VFFVIYHTTVGSTSPFNCSIVRCFLPAACALVSEAQLLQIASYLRQAGFFVVVALTRPFEFEGRRKVEADALIQALQDVAQLVVSSQCRLGSLQRANRC